MKLQYISRQQETDIIWTFTFAPSESICWVAGQSIRLQISGIYGPEERRFTIVSAPYERNVCISTNLSPSSFKQLLFGLKAYEEIDAFAVEGTFVMDQSIASAVWIAGGIGVTPFVSMLRDVAHAGMLRMPIHLYHLSSRAEVPFESELLHFADTHTSFSYIPLPFTSRIGPDIISSISKTDHIFVSGSTAMVRVTLVQLKNASISDQHIYTDWFSGNSSD